jgi:hypothetical protein
MHWKVISTLCVLTFPFSTAWLHLYQFYRIISVQVNKLIKSKTVIPPFEFKFQKNCIRLFIKLQKSVKRNEWSVYNTYIRQRS